MENIKVSIIIPVYNVEKYIDKCINSAVNQTLKDIEIIIIDDGSTDNSINIIKKYEIRYSNIVVVNQSNKGVSASRNIGLDKAKGEYIYFLDSDDYINLNLANDLYDLAKKQNLDIIHFDANVVYEDGFYSKNNPYDRSKVIESKVYSGKCFYENVKQNNGYRASVCTYIYKNEFLKKHKLNFYEGILHEDELFTTKSITLAESILYLPKKYFFRRMRGGSIMTSEKSVRNIIGYYTVAEQLYTYYTKNLNKLPIATQKILLETISGHYGYCNRLFLKIKNKSYKDYKTIEEINNSIRSKFDIYNQNHSKLLIIVNIIEIYMLFNYKINKKHIS